MSHSTEAVSFVCVSERPHSLSISGCYSGQAVVRNKDKYFPFKMFLFDSILLGNLQEGLLMCALNIVLGFKKEECVRFSLYCS